MSYREIGKNIQRVDAVAKVSGKAKYTADFMEREMLIGKILRSPYAHAVVKKMDITKAKELPGVEAIITYEDIPKRRFSTAGHPYNLYGHGDPEDRLMLTNKARFVGDSIAAVVARDELIAEEALNLITVEYEELKPILKPEEALEEKSAKIHEYFESNILSAFGGFDLGELEKSFAEADYIIEGKYETPIVQHCMLETNLSYAYQDCDGRIVIISSTQIPQIVRRVVGQALEIPWGRIRVIKPYIGGGFGNKQDVIHEPLNAFMTLKVGGRPVKLELSREESMIDSRTRHAIKYEIKTGVSKSGELLGMHIKSLSNTGAYASHGHAISASAGTKYRPLYNVKAKKYDPITVYTNLPVAGAMRGYGVPQIKFALESHIQDIADQLQMCPMELRKKNLVDIGYEDPISKNKVMSCGLRECIDKGRELIKWNAKKEKYKNQTGHKRKGLGMACFSYTSGTHPTGLEIAGARIIMNQDGSIQLQIGATEIGQGSDTVFAQMAAETIGIPTSMVHVISSQDTDITPFDPGSFASRQTYVSGKAVKKAAIEIKNKVLNLISKIKDIPADIMEIKDAQVIYKHNEEIIMSLGEACMYCYYDNYHSSPLSSDVTNLTRENAYSFGVTFVEVEVDILTGKTEILEIYNIHDSGKIINPLLAEGQVHGGVSMGIGYALAEEMLFHEETGKPLNNNLLDYKIATFMDVPEVGVDFIETFEPTGPYENKSLGEPPCISPAPAIRNAILNATGVRFNKIPITPQRAFEKFKEAGLID